MRRSLRITQLFFNGLKAGVKSQIGLRFDPNTVAKIETLREEIPAGGLADMVRYLMLRGMEAISADREARRTIARDPKP